MKRVYLILTLFMTSFFFISLNEVKADELNYIIPEDEISIVETDLFKRIRELAIELADSKNQYYLITIKLSDINTSNILVNLFNKGDYSIGGVTSNSYPTFNYNNVEINEYKYSSSSDSLSYYSRNYYPRFNFDRTIDSNIVYSQRVYLDSNIELLPLSSTEHTINLNYKDYIYTVNPGEHYPSLYQLKLLNDNVSGGSDVERNDSLDSFYVLVIEKIQIFANSFISNSACLFIIGIITLIFVFELVRRWLI